MISARPRRWNMDIMTKQGAFVEFKRLPSIKCWKPAVTAAPHEYPNTGTNVSIVELLLDLNHVSCLQVCFHNESNSMAPFWKVQMNHIYLFIWGNASLKQVKEITATAINQSNKVHEAVRSRCPHDMIRGILLPPWAPAFVWEAVCSHGWRGGEGCGPQGQGDADEEPALACMRAPRWL